MNTDELIARIKSSDENVRTAAWQAAGKVGAEAIQPLAALTGAQELEVARAAQRAIWQIVRHAGRPGAEAEKRAAVEKLILLLANDQPAALRRDVLWMLSEIAGDEAVPPMAALLDNAELREDARMALQRIPGQRSIEALRAGLDRAPADFKFHIAQSLRARGIDVPGLPSQKLKPTRGTSVNPAGR